MIEPSRRESFMARYGNADHITRMIHSNFDPLHMTVVMNTNPSFNKRHLAALYEKVPQLNNHARHDPLLMAMANHPDAHRSQLQKLVEPHKGWPWRGTITHLWPTHAKIANDRIKLMDHDEDDE